MAAEIRAACVEECEFLGDLMRRAAATLPGYSDDMLAHPEAVHILPDQVLAGQVLVAELDGSVAGFALWRPIGDLTAELQGIFVEAPLWRSGVGNDLMQAVCAAVTASGFKNLFASAVPPAVDFYRRSGFVRMGATATPLGPVLTMIKEIAGP